MASANLLAASLLLAALFLPAVAIVIGMVYVFLPDRKFRAAQPATREAVAHR